MNNEEKAGHESIKRRIAISKLLPVQNIRPEFKKSTRYRAIMSSLREVGLIEPLTVYKKAEHYFIMDGHARYVALKELGVTEVECLLGKADPVEPPC